MIHSRTRRLAGSCSFGVHGLASSDRLASRRIPVSFRRRVARAYEWTVVFSAVGLTVGMIAGSVIPLFGTVVGAVVGIGTGLLLGVVSSWLLVHKSFRLVLHPAWKWSAISAVICVALAWLLTPLPMSGFRGPAPGAGIAMCVCFVVPVVVPIFEIVRRSRKTPDVWPRATKGICPSCFYDMRGLGASVECCPECGLVMDFDFCHSCETDVTALRGRSDPCPECGAGIHTLACSECGYDFAGLDERVALCPECGANSIVGVATDGG